MSGSGSRPLDADQLPVTHLYLLELGMPFERWHVLGRTGGDAQRVRFTELGLRDSTDYVVFDYWARRLMPTDARTLVLGPLDTGRRAQALCIREVQAHPQLVATDRHVTCGGPDLKAVTWTGTALEGTSTLVGGETYTLYLREPAGFRAGAVTADGAQVVGSVRAGALRLVRLRTVKGRDVNWRVAYSR